MTERSRGQPETRPTGEPVRGDTTAALVLAPDDSRAKVRARYELLDATEPGETHVIGVVYDDGQFVHHVEEHDGLHPDSITVISVGDRTGDLADEARNVITVDPESVTTIADHVLDRIDDVRANFHLDPTTHPERARLALTTLFGTVVESPSGETWNRPDDRRMATQPMIGHSGTDGTRYSPRRER